MIELLPAPRAWENLCPGLGRVHGLSGTLLLIFG